MSSKQKRKTNETAGKQVKTTQKKVKAPAKKAAKDVTGCKGFTREEFDLMKLGFDMFDIDGTGRLNPKEMLLAMENLGFDERTPGMYNFIKKLDTPEVEKKGGVAFDNFIACLDRVIHDRTKKDRLKVQYEVFINNPDQPVINARALMDACEACGKKLTREKLIQIMKTVSTDHQTISFDDFVRLVGEKEE